jgi:hypothetical protein
MNFLDLAAQDKSPLLDTASKSEQLRVIVKMEDLA